MYSIVQIVNKILKWLAGQDTVKTESPLEVDGTTGHDIGFDISNTTSNKKIFVGVGASGSNRGIYDYADGKWLLVSTSSSYVYLNGTDGVRLGNRGIETLDRTGYWYPLIYDNGTNLWIGAPLTAGQHHTGETYISSGYDGSAGIDTIKVSVPNATNTGATNYKVLHEGLAPTRATVTLTDSVAYDSGRTPYVYKYGKVVTLVGAVKPKAQVAAGGSLAIGTIPSGYRPPVFHNVLCQGSGQNVWNLGVNTNGTLVGERYRAGTTNNPMPTTAWLTFSITYIIA